MEGNNMNSESVNPTVSCLIVDVDGSQAQKLYKELVNIPAVNIIAITNEPAESFKILKRNGSIDMVFFGTGDQNIYAFSMAVQMRGYVKCIVFIGEDSKCALSAFQAGADGFLAKPFNQLLLGDTIIRLIKTKVYGKLLQ